MNKKSKIIAFYISDHGFGHASRNIPIIRYILEFNNNINIIIKTGKAQGEFIKGLVGEFDGRIKYYFDFMDVGLVLKENSLNIDREKLTLKVEEYLETFTNRIFKENEFLHYNSVDLIVSDIVPWIFKSSKELNIPSILITNFTWVEIYKEHLSREICKKYRDCYRLADKALFYELYMEEMKDYIKDYEEVCLCSRDFDLEKVDKIKKKFKRPLVYISVGRSVDLRKEIDVSNLNYDFIVTDGIRLLGNNVYQLDKKTLNTQDYLMASDFVLTKAGWGTIAEAILAQKKIAIISRKDIAEDRALLAKLKEKEIAIEVIYEKFDIYEIIQKLYSYNPNYFENTFKNDYIKISKLIKKILEESYDKR